MASSACSSALASRKSSVMGETLACPKNVRGRSIVSLTASMHDHHMSRGKWNRKADFFFSIIGTSVGLGSLWRFPYLVFKHNGGGFLVIYIISMFLLGIPAFYLELLIGQYLGASQMSCISQFAPGLKGVGYCVTTIVFLVCIYYCVILSWTLHYTIGSLVALPGLPWIGCNNAWNTPRCYDPIHHNESLAQLEANNYTLNQSVICVEEYWFRRVLQMTDSFTEIDGVQPELVGALALAWLVIYFIVWKGLHSSGKVIWFSAIFPYVILVALFVQALLLDGAFDGLLFYVTPDWNTLLDPQAWIDGGTQITLSYSVGLGALFALGSYNKFNHNVYRDSLIVGVLNPVTAMFAGCVTFSVLGFLAKKLDRSIQDVVKEGPGLTFIAYPQVVAMMQIGPLWSLLFFSMMLFLGINSLFSVVEAIILAIVDNFPRIFIRRRNRLILNVAVCVIFLLLGLPFVTRGGLYLFTIVDEYAVTGIPAIWAIFFQTIAITWIWGYDRLERAMSQMMGKKVSKLWKISWMYILPLFLVSLLFFKVFKYTSVVQREPEIYPWWVEIVGWFMSLLSMLWIPGYFIYYILTQDGTIMENMKKAFHPQVMLQPNTQHHCNINGVANIAFIDTGKPSATNSARSSVGSKKNAL